MREKIWGKTLLTSYTCLERLANAIDGLVLSSSLHSSVGFNGTLSSANRILKLISRKKVLINIKVLVEKVLEKIPVDYARILVLKYFDKVKSADIAQVMGLPNRTYFRKLNQAHESFSQRLIKEGFSSNIIEKMVEEEKWILELFDSIYSKEKNSKLEKQEFEFTDLKLLNMAYASYKKINSYC